MRAPGQVIKQIPRRTRRLILAAMVIALVAVGIPAAGQLTHARAAVPDPACQSVDQRLAALKAQSDAYDAEVAAFNDAGGGTPAQVAAFNARKAAGKAAAAALENEKASCLAQSQSADVNPPPNLKKPPPTAKVNPSKSTPGGSSKPAIGTKTPRGPPATKPETAPVVEGAVTDASGADAAHAAPAPRANLAKPQDPTPNDDWAIAAGSQLAGPPASWTSKSVTNALAASAKPLAKPDDVKVRFASSQDRQSVRTPEQLEGRKNLYKLLTDLRGVVKRTTKGGGRVIELTQTLKGQLAESKITATVIGDSVLVNGPLDKLRRPSFGCGYITPDSINKGEKPDDTEVSGIEDGYDRSHLLAKLFGGTKELGNLAPGLKGPNRGAINRAEGDVRDIVEGNSVIPQQNMFVCVEPLYRGTEMIPEGFLFSAWGAKEGGGANLDPLYFPNTR